MNNTIALYKKITFCILCLCSCFAVQAGQWSNIGKVNKIDIYPTYVVVYQDVPASAGPANCANDTGFSFEWSSFPEIVQNRIMAMLLAARTTKQTIVVQISPTACGPEGKKLLSGAIEM